MKFSSLKNEIPLPIRLFLRKALLFYIVWTVIYGVFLFDSQLVDNLLTTHVGKSSTFVLNNLTPMSGFTAKNEEYSEAYAGEILDNKVAAIYHNNKQVLHIANACNGLELIVLYIGFIVCMPSNWKRKISYIIVGVILLDLINIFRCVGLIYLHEYYQTYFQFAHHYLFKITIYIATFLMWMMYCRKTPKKNEPIQIG